MTCWLVASGPLPKGMRIPDGPSLECVLAMFIKSPIKLTRPFPHHITVWVHPFGYRRQYMMLVKES